MKTFAIAIFALLFSVSSYASYKYEAIDSALLEKDSKEYLRKNYPTLTEHDIELLYPYKAVSLYNKERNINNDYI